MFRNEWLSLANDLPAGAMPNYLLKSSCTLGEASLAKRLSELAQVYVRYFKWVWAETASERSTSDLVAPVRVYVREDIKSSELSQTPALQGRDYWHVT